MKRTVVSIIIITFLALAFTQEVLKITKKDNTVLTIPTSEIVSLTFLGSEQPVSSDLITDVDGNSYNIVKIGMQSWTGKNLEVTKFKNGDPIMKAGSETEWAKAAAEGKPAWCYYLDASDYGKKYGILYNWYAVTDKRGLAPDGWRVSTKSDWEGLRSFLKSSTPGALLKEQGTANWIKNSGNTTNETGFTALPGGHRSDKGSFNSVGYIGYWWTTDQANEEKGIITQLLNDRSPLGIMQADKGFGYSVRLVKE
ncbi:MAG TPA: fibrobacter succinogenes major paralogous domain-containing protein [Clostridiales bacterium]|nr:fibrobacter succinogenes major paralogous domain-containing protein [Clostridiales bacterium]